MKTVRITPALTEAEDTQHQLTAFCATCPEPAEVMRVLQELGLRLVFSLDADDTYVVAGYPPLPAQYHYEDEVGTNVTYLAGIDAPCLADDDDDPETPSRYHYPAHASRFWLTPGGRELVARRVQDTLASAWNLRWLDLQTVQPIRGAA